MLCGEVDVDGYADAGMRGARLRRWLAALPVLPAPWEVPGRQGGGA